MKIKFVLVIALVAAFALSAMEASAQEKMAKIKKEEINNLICNADELERILPAFESDILAVKPFMEIYANKDGKKEYYKMVKGVKEKKAYAEAAAIYGLLLKGILEREHGIQNEYKIPESSYIRFKILNIGLERYLESIKRSTMVFREIKNGFELGPGAAPE